ncbi:MAG: DUF6576 domain-containing protein, partial [bacterium]
RQVDRKPPSPPPGRRQPPRSDEQIHQRRRLDELLDKVSDQGVAGLSPAERDELEELARQLKN